ncbi:hypothetical protein [Streptomyces sp. NPDC051567]|uniref:hypothetical protein n=1 Tax=Streptomyces sp. NPDC051567 TaxID=3365660 RepID=UPI0037A74474
MPTTLPLPIEFRLPEGWFPAPPDEVGAPGVAFVALHPRPDAGFTANITIAGEYRPDGATLENIADASVERLREATGSVVVAHRREIGSRTSCARSAPTRRQGQELGRSALHVRVTRPRPRPQKILCRAVRLP